VLWSMNFNLLGYPLDLNPHMIGTNYLPPENILEFKTKRVIWKDTEAMVDELDGSRPKLQHAGGNHGDISTSNIYLNFPPKQEKDDWLLHFSKNAVKPFNLRISTPGLTTGSCLQASRFTRNTAQCSLAPRPMPWKPSPG